MNRQRRDLELWFLGSNDLGLDDLGLGDLGLGDLGLGLGLFDLRGIRSRGVILFRLGYDRLFW